MNIDSVFPAPYLNADALDGKSPTLKIDRVDVHTFDPEGEKPVLYFTGKDAGLVLNKTRAMSLKALFGSDTEEWVGKQVKLGQIPVNVNGQLRQSITIAKAAAESGEAKKADTGSADEDDVPF
jgi:hypothetical protein